MKKKGLVLAGILCAGLLVLAGCGDEGKKEGTAANVWRVGTNATFVPFEFANEKQELSGFDIELVQELAKKAGATVEFKNVAFDGLIPALASKQIDLAASGMTITPARAEKIDFSLPYYEAGLSILVKDDSAITSVDELAGKMIAVQLGTTGADRAAEIPGAQLRTFDHNSEALLEMKKGGVDAVLSDTAVLQYYAGTTADAHVKVIPIQSDEPKYFGLAMAKGNTALKEKVDNALREMKKDGSLDALHMKYFNTPSAELPDK
ncbi:MAG: basic amino acid ABC transporter substrate-binding protein [Veillonellaceae bacterium]|nr:basic amino acid ABC transporter substrate-binding protein [Veillonellaceae bacterium]